ncbi:MAG: PleD family two-component system response regulator [bacterium]
MMINNHTKILIVDDDFSSRRLMAKLIHKTWSCQLIHADDGSEALKIMLKEVPNLVILVMMPFMNGMEVLRTMRQSARLAKIPVIACTAVDDTKIVKEIIKFGVTDYVVKPINKTLINKIAKIL